MEGKESRKRKISLPIIITILLYTIIISQNVLADDYIDATFTPQYNNPPIILNTEIPGNTSTNINIQPTCSIDILDIDGHLMTIYWYENSTGSWVLRHTTSSVPDGNYQWTYAQATSYSTKYWWKVAVTDSYNYTNATFHFTTEPEPPAPPQPPSPEPNEEPIANITAPDIGYVNETLIFYAYYSYDPDGYITGYRWDFDNDGLFDTNWSEHVFVTHKYLEPGNYTVKLQVMDDAGATATDLHNITIIPLEPPLELPIAEANGPYEDYTNEIINFSSNGSYDPDGVIVNYTWDFGDNVTSYLENPTHAYKKPGAYLVILIVKDNDNLSNLDIATVYVANRTQEPTEQIEFPFWIFIILTIIVTIIVILVYKKHETKQLMQVYEAMKKRKTKSRSNKTKKSSKTTKKTKP
jgi:PKD repeat protein